MSLIEFFRRWGERRALCRELDALGPEGRAILARDVFVAEEVLGRLAGAVPPRFPSCLGSCSCRGSIPQTWSAGSRPSCGTCKSSAPAVRMRGAAARISKGAMLAWLSRAIVEPPRRWKLCGGTSAKPAREPRFRRRRAESPGCGRRSPGIGLVSARNSLPTPLRGGGLSKSNRAAVAPAGGSQVGIERSSDGANQKSRILGHRHVVAVEPDHAVAFKRAEPWEDVLQLVDTCPVSLTGLADVDLGRPEMLPCVANRATHPFASPKLGEKLRPTQRQQGPAAPAPSLW